MKKIMIFISILLTSNSYSQLYEGQKFCEESKDYGFFPLAIGKKKILWYNTFYFETKQETKIFNRKIYIEFKQEWNKSSSDLIYFREENGVIYEYDSCCENETIRFDPKFEKNHVWKSANGKNEYRIITYDGNLKTPYCEYQNLLVVDAKMDYGTFAFYYLRGHGYIGATKDGKLVSCVSPEW